MPSRTAYKGVWGPEDVRQIRELARKIGIGDAYRKAWSDSERNNIKEIAERAGIVGPTGAYAACITRNGGSVVIDTDCLRRAAETAGIDEAYRKLWD